MRTFEVIKHEESEKYKIGHYEANSPLNAVKKAMMDNHIHDGTFSALEDHGMKSAGKYKLHMVDGDGDLLICFIVERGLDMRWRRTARKPEKSQNQNRR